MSRARRFFLFVVAALMFTLSLNTRHILSFAWHGSDYAIFSYSPEAVVWDETRAYGRFTHEIMRQEWFGNTLQSYNAFLQLPQDGNGVPWLRDRFPLLVLAGMSIGLDIPLSEAFFVFDMIALFILPLLLILMARKLGFSPVESLASAALFLCLSWQDLLNSIHSRSFPIPCLYFIQYF
jgi:hypothetical protein